MSNNFNKQLNAEITKTLMPQNMKAVFLQFFKRSVNLKTFCEITNYFLRNRKRGRKKTDVLSTSCSYTKQ